VLVSTSFCAPRTAMAAPSDVQHIGVALRAHTLTVVHVWAAEWGTRERRNDADERSSGDAGLSAIRSR
jgi:hypothetical protein